MQEDKKPLFDAHKSIILSICAMSGMIKDMKVNKDKMKESLNVGYLTATDLSDWLVQELNIPFRRAHSIAGKIVNIAENKKCKLSELSLDEMQTVEPGINKNVYDVLAPENSAKSKVSFGGTAPENVKEAINLLENRVKS